MKRLIDIVLALIGFVLLLVPMMVVAALVKLTSKGPVIYWSQRVGKDGQLFWLPKFRSMQFNTPHAKRRLDSGDTLTPIGRFIRNYSLDELPQLWPILKGEMSFVGPRPILPIESDFLAMRACRGVHRAKPGLTGWAQINGRDEITPSQKLELDVHYIEHQSLLFDLKIILLTIPRVISKAGVLDPGTASKKSG